MSKALVIKLPDKLGDCGLYEGSERRSGDDGDFIGGSFSLEAGSSSRDSLPSISSLSMVSTNSEPEPETPGTGEEAVETDSVEVRDLAAVYPPESGSLVTPGSFPLPQLSPLPSKRLNLPTLNHQLPPATGWSCTDTPDPLSTGPMDPFQPQPMAEFKFGSCPSTTPELPPLTSTPTVEKGPFEYPSPPVSPTTSATSKLSRRESAKSAFTQFSNSLHSLHSPRGSFQSTSALGYDNGVSGTLVRKPLIRRMSSFTSPNATFNDRRPSLPCIPTFSLSSFSSIRLVDPSSSSLSNIDEQGQGLSQGSAGRHSFGPLSMFTVTASTYKRRTKLSLTTEIPQPTPAPASASRTESTPHDPDNVASSSKQLETDKNVPSIPAPFPQVSAPAHAQGRRPSTSPNRRKLLLASAIASPSKITRMPKSLSEIRRNSGNKDSIHFPLVYSSTPSPIPASLLARRGSIPANRFRIPELDSDADKKARSAEV